MEYSIKQQHAMNIIGSEIKTSYEKSSKEIPDFWAHVKENTLLGFIPNRTDKNRIYAIYTDYDPDPLGNYTLILGAEVTSLHDTPVPDNMVARVIPGGSYAFFSVSGEHIGQAITDAWEKIADMNLQRSYTYDFEVYDLHLLGKEPPEARIWVALKDEAVQV